MKIVTREFMEVAKKHRLLYDGSIKPPKNLNSLVDVWGGRTYATTKHNYYVSDGEKGIYNIVNRIIARDNILKITKKNVYSFRKVRT
jgi:hypothetical protein